MKPILALLLATLVTGSNSAQTPAPPPRFDVLLREARGDLDGDGLADRAVILLDTVLATRPLRLDIALARPDGGWQTVFSSADVIDPMYPADADPDHEFSQVPDVYIEDGWLRLDFYIAGNSRYTFRYNEDRFELIYFTHVRFADGVLTETEFDLLTGAYRRAAERHETGEVISVEPRDELIRPLPTLEGFRPFAAELY